LEFWKCFFSENRLNACACTLPLKEIHKLICIYVKSFNVSFQQQKYCAKVAYLFSLSLHLAAEICENIVTIEEIAYDEQFTIVSL